MTRQCFLCGVTSDQVRPGLACYREDGRFDHVDRCIDHQACRARVEANGNHWPLIDITNRTRHVA